MDLPHKIVSMLRKFTALDDGKIANIVSIIVDGTVDHHLCERCGDLDVTSKKWKEIVSAAVEASVKLKETKKKLHDQLLDTVTKKKYLILEGKEEIDNVIDLVHKEIMLEQKRLSILLSGSKASVVELRVPLMVAMNEEEVNPRCFAPLHIIQDLPMENGEEVEDTTLVIHEGKNIYYEYAGILLQLSAKSGKYFYNDRRLNMKDFSLEQHYNNLVAFDPSFNKYMMENHNPYAVMCEVVKEIIDQHQDREYDDSLAHIYNYDTLLKNYINTVTNNLVFTSHIPVTCLNFLKDASLTSIERSSSDIDVPRLLRVVADVKKNLIKYSNGNKAFIAYTTLLLESGEKMKEKMLASLLDRGMLTDSLKTYEIDRSAVYDDSPWAKTLSQMIVQTILYQQMKVTDRIQELQRKIVHLEDFNADLNDVVEVLKDVKITLDE